MDESVTAYFCWCANNCGRFTAISRTTFWALPSNLQSRTIVGAFSFLPRVFIEPFWLRVFSSLNFYSEVKNDPNMLLQYWWLQPRSDWIVNPRWNWLRNSFRLYITHSTTCFLILTEIPARIDWRESTHANLCSPIESTAQLARSSCLFQYCSFLSFILQMLLCILWKFKVVLLQRIRCRIVWSRVESVLDYSTF